MCSQEFRPIKNSGSGDNIAQIKLYAAQLRKGAIRLHEKGYAVAEDFYSIADYFDRYVKEVEARRG